MAEGDVVDVLTHDHDKVEELFQRYDRATSTTEKNQLAENIVIELLRHAAVEEKVVYPEARKIIPNGDEVIGREIAQQAAVERTMTTLSATNPADPDFARLMRELMEMIREHVWEQEEVWFPQLRQRMSADNLRQLTEQVEAMYGTAPTQAAAPTMPRSSASDRPPVRLLLGVGTEIVERARQLVAGLVRVVTTFAEFIRRPAAAVRAARAGGGGGAPASVTG
ncbi:MULTISPECIES: hemerythrin domain-containing protein [unclassified Frankia]|uniref:hemerythrin domain-containing protein n=2 Tax=Frankia TaxID=1854 RepID=UPI002AD41D13|nr:MULTISPECIES: hemerythrin domain-containing protein [unclassified Frankia]